jgi:hypothetical protein
MSTFHVNLQYNERILLLFTRSAIIICEDWLIFNDVIIALLVVL